MSPCPWPKAAAVGHLSLEVELTSQGGPHLAWPSGKPAVLNPTWLFRGCPSRGCPFRGYSHLLFIRSPLHGLVGAGRAGSVGEGPRAVCELRGRGELAGVEVQVSAPDSSERPAGPTGDSESAAGENARGYEDSGAWRCKLGHLLWASGGIYPAPRPGAIWVGATQRAAGTRRGGSGPPPFWRPWRLPAAPQTPERRRPTPPQGLLHPGG